MLDDGHLDIDGTVRIPASELTFRATRSGGPGGQHVNTSATRVELTWNAAASTALDDEQRARVLASLASRIDGSGVLRLTEGGSRSQARNKEEVTDRFRGLLAEALRVPPARRRTRPPRAAKEARLRDKRRRSERKKARGPVDEVE